MNTCYVRDIHVFHIKIPWGIFLEKSQVPRLQTSLIKVSMGWYSGIDFFFFNFFGDSSVQPNLKISILY